MRKVILAVSGASGSIYARQLMDHLARLRSEWSRVGVVFSGNARTNWELETGGGIPDGGDYPFDFYANDDFFAPFASGSAQYDTMIICPCSMGVVGRVASGISDDLITRAADVVLKERHRLIVVPRETPLSMIHLQNMLTLTQAGAVVCPAVPSYYSKPVTVEALADTVSSRVLALAGFDTGSYRWGEDQN